MKTLKELAETARTLANDLFKDESTECSQTVRCMEREEKRFLSTAEKRQGWTRRPFSAYDSNKMCAGCRAYWHAENAAQQLHETYCWQQRAEMETERNAKPKGAVSS